MSSSLRKVSKTLLVFFFSEFSLFSRRCVQFTRKKRGMKKLLSFSFSFTVVCSHPTSSDSSTTGDCANHIQFRPPPYWYTLVVVSLNVSEREKMISLGKTIENIYKHRRKSAEEWKFSLESSHNSRREKNHDFSFFFVFASNLLTVMLLLMLPTTTMNNFTSEACKWWKHKVWWWWGRGESRRRVEKNVKIKTLEKASNQIDSLTSFIFILTIAVKKFEDLSSSCERSIFPSFSTQSTESRSERCVVFFEQSSRLDAVKLKQHQRVGKQGKDKARKESSFDKFEFFHAATQSASGWHFSVNHPLRSKCCEMRHRSVSDLFGSFDEKWNENISCVGKNTDSLSLSLSLSSCSVLFLCSEKLFFFDISRKIHELEEDNMLLSHKLSRVRRFSFVNFLCSLAPVVFPKE